MPTNLYGENDNFNLQNSHVIPALIHKAHLAKIKQKKYLTVWALARQRRISSWTTWQMLVFLSWKIIQKMNLLTSVLQ